jgi:paraquat-inducible protein A
MMDRNNSQSREAPHQFAATSQFLASAGVVACPDCDLLNRIDWNSARQQVCPRCNAVLFRPRPNGIERGLACVSAAFIFFVLANTFPFLAMKSAGLVQETTMLSGIRELWHQKGYLLSGIIFLTCFLLPLLQLCGLLYILAPLYVFKRPAPQAIHAFRTVKELSPWCMTEVFLIGVIVALVKLGHMATIIPGVSVFSLGAFIFIIAAAHISLDHHDLWSRLGKLS